MGEKKDQLPLGGNHLATNRTNTDGIPPKEKPPNQITMISTKSENLSRESFVKDHGELDPLTRQLIRQAAARALVTRGATEVGSSDVSNELYERWVRNGGGFEGVILEFVNES